MHSGEVTDLSSERPGLERDVEREMREEWDARARENAFHYIDDSKDEWRPEEFFASGEESVRQLILNDMDSICQEMPPNRNARPGDRLWRRAYDSGPG